MRLPEQFRTTTFHIAAGYSAFFIMSVAIIMGTAYWIATHELRGTLQTAISEDLQIFRTAFEEGGLNSLQSAVNYRSEGGAGDHFFLLLDSQDRVLAGNIPAALWSEGWVDRKLGRKTIRASADLEAAAMMNSDHEVLLFSYGMMLGPNKVLAGRNSHALDETREILLAAFGWGSLVTAILAMVGGYFISKGPNRRVDEMAVITRQIIAGRFDIRLPVTSKQDELDRLAANINAMLARIQVLMESLKQVSTDIAHDLRTPLARLRQRLDVALRNTQADHEAALSGAITEADAIIDTFNALLRIAQIEAGARRAKFRAVDLSALCIKINEAYGDVAEDAGRRLKVVIEDDIVIEGDADLLTQAIANLIENAINHIPAGGRIVLSLRRNPDGIILDVCDNGPGVPDEEREKIFRRLYRLEHSRTSPGSGLGLALVLAIVDLHGATIEAINNNPGLRMRITFPAH